MLFAKTRGKRLDCSRKRLQPIGWRPLVLFRSRDCIRTLAVKMPSFERIAARSALVVFATVDFRLMLLDETVNTVSLFEGPKTGSFLTYDDRYTGPFGIQEVTWPCIDCNCSLLQYLKHLLPGIAFRASPGARIDCICSAQHL